MARGGGNEIWVKINVKRKEVDAPLIHLSHISISFAGTNGRCILAGRGTCWVNRDVLSIT
jgi:hypothetical protein